MDNGAHRIIEENNRMYIISYNIYKDDKIAKDFIFGSVFVVNKETIKTLERMIFEKERASDIKVFDVIITDIVCKCCKLWDTLKKDNPKLSEFDCGVE